MRSLPRPRILTWGMTLGLAVIAALPLSVRAQSTRSSSDSNSGYVDSAIPSNRFRLRYDSAYDDTSADRGEFFYAQYQQQTITGAPGSVLYVNTPPSGQVATSGGGGGGSGGGGGANRGRDDNLVFAQPGQLIGNPAARGLPRPETKIDYQEVSAYVEVKATDNLSGFVELPVRFLNPEVNSDTKGLGDMNAGFKWAFWSDEDLVTTFQLRTYIPTGNSTQGLGTDHVSLEPALLTWSRLGEKVIVEGEFRDWIPIGGTDFAGNVIRYGVAVSANVYETAGIRVTPVTELVGWTVLNGKETVALTPTLFEIRDAGGSTIVNAKIGVRTWFNDRHDVYVGYGRALTGDVWYKDILRLEYRLSF